MTFESTVSRGPVIGTVSKLGSRNVIGSHGGSYAVYRALAVSSGTLDPIRRPDLTNTHPAAIIGPFPQWTEPEKIVSLDPWGHVVARASDGVGIVTTRLDAKRVDAVREMIPVAKHRVKVGSA